MMASRADSAYLSSDRRKFFHRSAFTKFFKSSEFGYLKKYITWFSFFVKENFYFTMALKPCDQSIVIFSYYFF
jgi:hypothetical protein